MAPNFTEDFGGYRVLKCPACGTNNVHHTSVEVFEREEDKDGLHVVVEGGSVRTDTVMKGNPSHRRHGIRLLLSCESCPALSALTIVQHKGETEFRAQVIDHTAGWNKD